MQGRYGNDQLNFAILLISLFCGLFSFFTRGVASTVFSLLQAVLLVLWALRAFSRNRYARADENRKYLIFWGKFKQKNKPLFDFFARLADRKHKYFKCPNCKARLRVPRGRGSITVTCPRCKNKFDKKS